MPVPAQIYISYDKDDARGCLLGLSKDVSRFPIVKDYGHTHLRSPF